MKTSSSVEIPRMIIHRGNILHDNCPRDAHQMITNKNNMVLECRKTIVSGSSNRSDEQPTCYPGAIETPEP